MNSEKLNTDSQLTEEISLKELILKMNEWCKFLFSKWITIAVFVILGAILGYLYAYFEKPVYTASTTFVLEEGASGNSSLSGLGGLASMAGIDLDGGGGNIFQGDNILELYKSRKMIEKTLLTEVDFNGKKQLLVNRYIDFNKKREKWKNDPELRQLQFDKLKKETIDSSLASSSRLQDSILSTIVDDINGNYLNVAKPNKKLSIIKADVQSIDEAFAKSFNQEIVRNVNDFYLQTKTKKALGNMEILQQKVDSVRGVMNGAIYKAVAASDATPNLNPTRQVQRIVPIQRSQFNAETNKQVLGELVKNLEISKITLHKETPLIQVVDQPTFPLKKKELGRAKGIILGSFVAGFLTTLILLIRKIFKGMMA